MCIQADKLLKEKLGLKAQARSNSWHRSSLQETLTRYLNFVHFFAFCLLSLLKTVVSSQVTSSVHDWESAGVQLATHFMTLQQLQR